MTNAGDTYNIDKIVKQSIVAVLKNLYRRNLISALSGNISVRIPHTNYIWITPSGVHKAMLKVNDLVKIDLDGNILEGRNKPSSEWRMHVAIYKVRPDVYAVVHTHSPTILVLDALDIAVDPNILMESKYYIRGVAYVPEVEPGSEELAKLVAEKSATNANVIVLKRHGVVAIGKNLYEAEAIVEFLEDVAIVQLYSLIVKALTNCVNRQVGTLNQYL